MDTMGAEIESCDLAHFLEFVVDSTYFQSGVHRSRQASAKRNSRKRAIESRWRLM